MMHAMNDIRVLLNNVFTKEYILESLQQDKKIQTKDTLGTDQIRAFLAALVHLIVSSASPEQLLAQYESSKAINSILSLKQSLAEVAKIVLDQFMMEGKDMNVRQSETQRILQEMLLDIVVAQLEQRSYNELKEQKIDSRMVENIELLKMLSAMIQVNLDDKKQDVPESADLDSAVNQLANPSLTVGSKQLTRCASLLAHMLLNIEVPAVVRPTAKCARVLFKLVDM